MRKLNRTLKVVGGTAVALLSFAMIGLQISFCNNQANPAELRENRRIQMSEKYASLQEGQSYKLLDEFNDCFIVQCGDDKIAIPHDIAQIQ